MSLRVIKPCDSFSRVAPKTAKCAAGMLFFRHIDTAFGETPTNLATFVVPPSRSMIAESVNFSFIQESYTITIYFCKGIDKEINLLTIRVIATSLCI